MSEYDVIAEAQPGPQTSLIACPHFEVFFGGARGGAKTYGMLLEWVSHQSAYGEHCIGLMIRRERTQLVETIEESRKIYLPLGAKFNEVDKMWRFPNGSRLQFAYLDRDSDAEAYQGRSYSRLYVEEVTNFPMPGPILKMMATLRSGHGIPCGFRATGNPGGPGHQWVKARYIDPAPQGWQVITEAYRNPWTGETVNRERIFIPSRLQDNRFLGADYVANLQMVGSPTLVRAWLEGDWSVIEGAFFSEWSSEKHVISPFQVPANWLRFRAADWGSAAPFAIGWWTVATDNYPLGGGNGRELGLYLPRGALICYKEWYGASVPNVGLKLPAEEVAQGILERETPEERDAIRYSVLDPSAFSSDGGPSIAERISSKGVHFQRADNKRISQRGAMGGWDQVRARLLGDGERPMLYVFSTCKDLIRTLPALQHDSTRPEDVDTESEDHACDAARYACMSRPYIRTVEAQKARGKIFSIGPQNQISLDDLWDNQPRRTAERI